MQLQAKGHDQQKKTQALHWHCDVIAMLINIYTYIIN